MNSYELSRIFFDWCFENPEKIKPNHTALYFFTIEHCNRLGWRRKFGLPTEMAKEAIGIKSYNTYINTLNDLVDWGFIKMVEKSKNQYSSNIITLSKFDKALDKSLDKAIGKHVTKQSESTVQSIDSINKPLTKELKKPENVARAIDFLKNNFPSRFETDFLMKYKSKIDNPKKFAEDFNDTVDQEKLEFEDKVLFGRLGKYARNWIENQSKHSKTPSPDSYESGKLPRL